jgi:hypothetical protein
MFDPSARSSGDTVLFPKRNRESPRASSAEINDRFLRFAVYFPFRHLGGWDHARDACTHQKGGELFAAPGMEFTLEESTA